MRTSFPKENGESATLPKYSPNILNGFGDKNAAKREVPRNGCDIGARARSWPLFTGGQTATASTGGPEWTGSRGAGSRTSPPIPPRSARATRWWRTWPRARQPGCLRGRLLTRRTRLRNSNGSTKRRASAFPSGSPLARIAKSPGSWANVPWPRRWRASCPPWPR